MIDFRKVRSIVDGSVLSVPQLAEDRLPIHLVDAVHSFTTLGLPYA